MSDSGAQANCYPQRIIDANPHLVTRITAAPPNTGLVFGNNQSQTTSQIAHLGDYTAHITPDTMQDFIIAHAPIIDAGHIIVKTKTKTIIRDVGEQYEVYATPNLHTPTNGISQSTTYSTSYAVTTHYLSTTQHVCSNPSASKARAPSKQLTMMDSHALPSATSAAPA